MRFERVRQVLARLTQGPIAITTPTPAPGSAVPADNGSAAAAAPAPIQSVRADLIEIKVDGLDQAKKNAVWLTKGLDRSQPATAIRLVDCTSDHLKNILLNKPSLSPDYRRVIESILEDRGENLPDASDLHPDFTD